MRTRTVLALLALVVGGGAAFAVACDSPSSQIYSAAPFDTVNFCLDPYQAVDVVNGGGGGNTCAPICLVNAGAVYVSTVCPPYPDPTVWDESGQNASCPAALAAYARMDECSADGGSSNPLTDFDSGGYPPDVDGGDDGSQPTTDAPVSPSDAPGGDAPVADAPAND